MTFVSTTAGKAAEIHAARMPRGERRAKLLDAANEVFTSRGYHAAAMDDIAEAAGVSKPVLYQHFSSKLDLYLGPPGQQLRTLVDVVREALASTDDNADRVVATVGRSTSSSPPPAESSGSSSNPISPATARYRSACGG